MSEQLNDKEFAAGKANESVNFQSGSNFDYSKLLDVVGVLSVACGILCAATVAGDAVSAAIFVAVGFLSFIWLHVAAIVVAACKKYLDRG